MCRLRNITMHDYQESVTTGQMDGQTDTGKNDPYVPLCFADDTINQHMCIDFDTKNQKGSYTGHEQHDK